MVLEALNGADDDRIQGFQLQGAPVRGRYARLGRGTIDPILRRHAYPRPVALLLGEALTLAALVGALFKSAESKLTIQTEGVGPAPLLVVEYRGDGGLRGYVRMKPGAAEQLAAANALPPRDLLGAGALLMTVETGDVRHQGAVPLEGATLAECAEGYFDRSEQIPTRVRLAVAEEISGAGRPIWRSGGALIQQVAPDDPRGDTEEAWSRAQILFDTLTDAELADPALPAERVLYRLFHEDGVRAAPPHPLVDKCTCDEARLVGVMQRFTATQLSDLVEPDGLLHARCQFCGRLYLLKPEDVAGRPR
jgi:molecular chaperone Hsp33